jgi:hypothetical protein
MDKWVNRNELLAGEDVTRNRKTNEKLKESISTTIFKNTLKTFNDEILKNGSDEYRGAIINNTLTTKQVMEILTAMIECREKQTQSDCHLGCKKCDDCLLCYQQGTIGEGTDALRFALDKI